MSHRAGTDHRGGSAGMHDIDVLVVGAGVVGLAVARALAMTGRSVVVAEAAGAIGSGTSSRNSEVIHSGIHYPPGSLKARLCLRGRHLLYGFCDARGVRYDRCGKLIVATHDGEVAAVQSLGERGRANGVDDLRWLPGGEVRGLEPALRSCGALLAPSTGILDSHGFMLALRDEAEAFGAVIAFRTPVLAAEAGDAGLVVETGGAEPTRVRTAALVNCAGLHASEVAGAIRGLDPAHVPATSYAKGTYFALRGRAPFRHLIYPAPQAHGLGVHLTFDLGGQSRFGPDVEWVDAIDYGVDPRRGAGFAAAIRNYWPDLRDDDLMPGYSGIRPKLAGPLGPAADFRIDGAEVHGIPGLVNLFGIESPGLTSSLAIAEEVVSRL